MPNHSVKPFFHAKRFPNFIAGNCHNFVVAVQNQPLVLIMSAPSHHISGTRDAEERRCVGFAQPFPLPYSSHTCYAQETIELFLPF